MRLFSCLGVVLGLTVSPLVQAAGQKLASVEVTVEGDSALAAAAGIRTLYISVFDSESKMPRPYGSIQVKLQADAKGSIYKGDLTLDNIQVMGDKASVPKKLRLKARLDKNGAGGMDQPGDVVGSVDDVNVGDTAKIVINKKI
ncbi:MAG TPA: hypothetical protein VE954_41325 [Oligoflexus sp.]|uniref:hypothetical protein n=1 Tax=Oligoflexus sp. TaxID=1971216 RepID=UPI002D42C703|nr:hypothetical protein [Oligoflexus sp.]HYX39584.1 hypothetical protein [Oligoflexus sp.]